MKQLKNTIIEIKNSLDGINTRMEVMEEGDNELEDRSIKIIPFVCFLISYVWFSTPVLQLSEINWVSNNLIQSKSTWN